MIFNRGPRREVPQRVANPLWTSSKNQKIRMLGKSILVIMAVVDHVAKNLTPPTVKKSVLGSILSDFLCFVTFQRGQKSIVKMRKTSC